MNKLTKRQQILVNQLKDMRFSSLADVGCDHGYIGEAVLSCGISKFVYFCDVSAPSLEKAKSLSLEKENCEFVVQDGLGKLNVDCAVIAGMGGKETIEILEKAENLPQTLLLQPMKNQRELRLYLCKDYRIEKDFVIFDKKYYFVILCRRGNDSLTELEQYFGRTNLQTPSSDFRKYIHARIDKYEKIRQNTSVSEIKEKLSRLYLCLKEINDATGNV